MREEGVVLEDHCDLVAAELAQGLGLVLDDVFAVEQDPPFGGFDQPDQAARQGGFAAARQPHDDKGASPGDSEGEVAQPDDQVQLVLDFVAALVGVFGLEGALGPAAEHLPEAVDFDVMVLLVHVRLPSDLKSFTRLPLH